MHELTHDPVDSNDGTQWPTWPRCCTGTRATADPADVPGVVRFAHLMLDLSPDTTDLAHTLTIAAA
jgi:hypothetical protein